MTSMQLRYPLQFVEIPMPKETLGPTAQAHHNGRFHSWVTLFQACCSGPTTKGHASESSEIHIDTARKTAVLQSENPRRVYFCASPCTTACTPALLWGPFFCFQYPSKATAHAAHAAHAASHPRVIPDLLATRQLRHGIQQKHDILGSVCFHLWPLAPSSSWLNHSTVHLGISGTARVVTGHHHKALRGQKLSEEDIAGAVGPRTMRENH